MTNELERVTAQRDYNRRLVDHQQTVIDRLNAQITDSRQDALIEQDAALQAADAMMETLQIIANDPANIEPWFLARQALATYRASRKETK